MPSFLVLIDVSNLLVDIDGKVAKYGFLTHVLVDAADKVAGEDLAIDSIREDEELASVLLNDENDPPVITVQEFDPAESLDELDVPAGRIWYEMNPKRWWQFWRR